MPSLPAGVMCQILHISADQRCSVNFNGQRSVSKAVDFRALTQRAEALKSRGLDSPSTTTPTGAHAGQQLSAEVKDLAWYSLMHHLKTDLALVWLLTPTKPRAIKRGYNRLYPSRSAAWRPPWNSCSSLIQCTTTHQLGSDFLKEHDSGLAWSSLIPIGLFWQSCNYRGIHPLDSLPAFFPGSFARKDNLPFRVLSVRRGCPDRSMHPVPDLDPEEFGKPRLFSGD